LAQLYNVTLQCALFAEDSDPLRYPPRIVGVKDAFHKEASGASMVDVDGGELIDFAGGIGVNNVGNCHPKVVAVIRDQDGKFIHTCFHVAMYEPYVELAKRLNALAPGEDARMTFFANSGAEALENAVKVARCYEKGRVLLSCGSHGNVIRTLMPLVITDAQLQRGLAIFEESLDAVSH